jgi:F-type H+-transporting ATPase subunit a
MCVFVLSFFAIKSYSFVPNTKHTNQKTETYDPVPNIMHHIADAHDWHLWGEGENSFSIPLPVILWDEELHVFSSSKLHHGLEVAASGNKYYKLDHGKIYRTDASGIISFDQSNQCLDQNFTLNPHP